MRMSDWSSDVCSSDLACRRPRPGTRRLSGATDERVGLWHAAPNHCRPAGERCGRPLHLEQARTGGWARGASGRAAFGLRRAPARGRPVPPEDKLRSEEHTSELQSLMRISYAVFCLKKKQKIKHNHHAPTTSTHTV